MQVSSRILGWVPRNQLQAVGERLLYPALLRPLQPAVLRLGALRRPLVGLRPSLGVSLPPVAALDRPPRPLGPAQVGCLAQEGLAALRKPQVAACLGGLPLGALAAQEVYLAAVLA